MKKSQFYRKLQLIVLDEDIYFDHMEKLEVLRELFVQEDLAKYAEEQEEQKQEEEQA